MADLATLTRDRAAGVVRNPSPFTLLHAGPDAMAWKLRHVADGEERVRFRVYRRQPGGWGIENYPTELAAVAAVSAQVEVAA